MISALPDVSENVKNGLAWLDVNIPDWKDRDYSEFKFTNTNRCMLAIAGKDDYLIVANNYGLNINERVRLGFSAGTWIEWSIEKETALQLEWERELQKLGINVHA